MKLRSIRRIALLATLAVPLALSAQSSQYHVTNHFKLGGDGSWDYLSFDTAGHRIFIARENRVMVVDASTGKLIANIPLGGKPEFGVSAGNGKVYANIEDRSQVVEIDTRTMKVVRRWPLAPCESPSGLAIDRAHMRLFSGCHSKVMAVSDIKRGAVVGTVPIGSGVDANKFDPGTGLAFSSNGDGTITVAHETKPGAFAVLQTIKTMPAARTMTFDPKTHKLYTVSAEFGPAPAQVAGALRRRPPVVPGSFVLIEMSR